MNNPITVMVTCLSFLSACSLGSSEVTPETKNAIAACSSVVEVSDSAEVKLETDLDEALKGENSIGIEAGIESAVRGVFSEDTLKTESGVKAFNGYLECIKLKLQPGSASQ